MELIAVKEKPKVVETMEQVLYESSDENFIQANTIPVNLSAIKEECIIPSFAKDNESTISHTEFIEAISETVSQVFRHETIYYPAIRVSHPISGRIPEAMGKPAKELQDFEKTLYYERLAFIIEVPSIFADIHGNTVSMTIGGVRAYNLENLYGRKIEEKFKIFIGFQNKVCTNLCITTDGFKSELKVRTTAELMQRAFELFSAFRYEQKVSEFSALGNLFLTEHQFAQILGKMRLYQYLPLPEKKELEPVPLNDSQVAAIAKDYYCNQPFCRESNGDINLWKLYNLFTSANKSSYIDTFLDRGLGCLNFAQMLQNSLKSGCDNWFLL